MSFLYKEKKDVKYSVDIEQQNDIIKLEFTADCGKFGTDETLDMFHLTPLQLLEMLQAYEGNITII